ncbi:MAG: 4-hydroxy-3-methylbut-2-enyl diphosphate reductase [Sphingobacteriales bacterium]|jgi:4-hydroxy-3-methylbut-2-enyl diphosphate reductase
MKNLQVTIDENSGFCFGVVYAIEMAEEILQEDGELYCLGDIVHNDMEVERLTAKGLKIIDHDDLQELKDVKVLIRAHGEPPETYKLAMKNNITLLDASCPVVLKLQNRVKQSYDQEEKIVIFGKPGHAEVKGLNGQTVNNAIIIKDKAEIDTAGLPKKFTLYSQTTKSTDKFYELKDELISKGYDVQAKDTICRQVSNRDGDLSKFANNFNKIVFVAGKKSSNGKVLYDVCRKHNANTYFVSTLSEIKPQWFENSESVGICGATSTPMWLMEEVKSQLQTF